MTNNADWTRGVGYLEFLRDVGKYLTINYMMAKDSVRAGSRATPASATPSSRTCCCRRSTSCTSRKPHGCRLQVGGSDQYGNITAGCELSRKMGGPQLFGLTAPLLLDSSGQKMGKTSTGERVWLDPERTLAVRVLPVLVQRRPTTMRRACSRMFSLRPLAELDELLPQPRRRSREAASRSASSRARMTTWVHGDADDRAASRQRAA